MSCKDEDSVKEQSPYIELSQSYIECSYGNTDYEIQIITNCEWLVTKKPSWVEVDKMEGNGNDTIVVTVNSNSDSNIRYGDIQITSKNGGITATVLVSQSSWNFNHYEDKW